MELIRIEPRRAWWYVVAFTLLVFVVDSSTGYEIAVSIFYLIPVSIATWFISRNVGLFVSIVCAVLWLVSEDITGRPYSNELIPLWNMLVRLGFFVIVTVTLAERSRIHAELVRTREDALTASRAKSDFVSRVTHEVRTPLTAILGFADVLSKRAELYLTPDDQNAIRRIRSNAHALLQLVDSVLELGRAEAGKTVPQLTDVDLKELLNTVDRDMQNRVNPEAVQFVVDVPADVASVQTDPYLLRQILLNLVANAIKFTERGHVHVRLETNGSGEPSAIVVEDTGIGIPPARMQAIFQPFEQADASIHRAYGGAGLGLAIAKDLCELLDFELTAESVPAEWSRFTIRLTKSPSATVFESA